MEAQCRSGGALGFFFGLGMSKLSKRTNFDTRARSWGSVLRAVTFVPEFGGRRDDDAGDVICEFDLRAVLPTVLRAPPHR
jgi:hypothetical protein